MSPTKAAPFVSFATCLPLASWSCVWVLLLHLFKPWIITTVRPNIVQLCTKSQKSLLILPACRPNDSFPLNQPRNRKIDKKKQSTQDKMLRLWVVLDFIEKPTHLVTGLLSQESYHRSTETDWSVNLFFFPSASQKEKENCSGKNISCGHFDLCRFLLAFHVKESYYHTNSR